MIKTEEEFQSLMKAIDRELRDENVPISARPMHGWLKVCHKLHISLRLTPEPDREPEEGCYSGDDLTTRIFRWFEKLYGEKLKVDWSVGSIAVKLAGDVYRLKYPKILGSAVFVADPAEMGKKERNLGNQLIVNVLDYIEGLSPRIVSTIGQKQLHELLVLFHLGYSFFEKMRSLAENSLIPEALGDISASSFHLFQRPPELGLSKWCSLQAVEKMIKAYISKNGHSFKQTHNLTELAIAAENIGLGTVSREDLQVVQCSPRIRYDSTGLALSEVVAAQHAAIRVCSHIVEKL